MDNSVASAEALSPKVFISYSHDSAQHAEAVLMFSDRLRDDGVDATIDQYEQSPAEGWPKWMESQLETSDFVLIVCTEGYIAKLESSPETPTGRGVAWEASLIQQHLYNSKLQNRKFIPVLVNSADQAHIPLPLQATTRFVIQNDTEYELLLRLLTNQPAIQKPTLGRLRSLPRRPQVLTAENSPRLAIVEPEVLSLSSFSASLPPRPDDEVSRENILLTIKGLFETSADLIALEGDQGIGKTNLSAQFVRAFKNNAISVFVRPSSRASYDSETIGSSLMQQVTWALHGKRGLDQPFRPGELKSSYVELQRRARREKTTFYFVIDGLADVERIAPGTIQTVLESLPLGSEHFKFLVSGDLSFYSPHLPSTLRPKMFPVCVLGGDDVARFFGPTLSGHLPELLRATRGIPGRMSDLKRLIQSGASVGECIQQLRTGDPSMLLAAEWKNVDRKNDQQLRALALLAHDDRVHTLESIAETLSRQPAEVFELFRKLTFVKVTPTTNVATFTSEQMRQFAADQLRAFKTWVHKLHVQRLLDPSAGEDEFGEVEGSDSGEFQHLLDLLTPDYIFRLLSKYHNLSKVQKAVDYGLVLSRRLERDGDLLRFSIQRSLLRGYLASGVAISEATALATLGQYEAAEALGNSALLREDRLHILSISARARLKRGRVIPPELMDQIRVLSSQVDLSALGSRTIDIAAELVCVDHSLALSLVDRAKPTEIEREQAFARLSLLTLETLGQERSSDLLGYLHSRAPKGNADLLMHSISFLSKKWAAAEVIAYVQKVEAPRDKLFLIQSWLNSKERADSIDQVVRYALDIALQAPEGVIDARLLYALARNLHSQADLQQSDELVGMFDAHKGAANRIGPTVDYVKLQIALALCELRDNKSSAENRLLEISYDVSQVKDVTTRAEAWAWLLNGIEECREASDSSSLSKLSSEVLAELDDTFVTLIDGTADHERASAGAISALAPRYLNKAFEYASMLNTVQRRDRAFLAVVGTLSAIDPEQRINDITKTISNIENTNLRDEAISLLIGSAFESDRRSNSTEESLFALTAQISAAVIRVGAIARVMAMNSSRPSGIRDEVAKSLIKAWEAIDVGWLRVRTGFDAATVLADTHSDVSAEILRKTEQFRLSLKGMADEDSEDLYVLCVQLAIRAFSGLVTKHVYQQKDLDTLAVLIDKVPGNGAKAILWSELALRCVIHENRDLCLDIFHERVAPALSGLSDEDADYRNFVHSVIAPTHYEVSENGALSALSGLPPAYRDRAYSNIASYLFRHRSPADPEDYVSGVGYDTGYTRLLQICELMKHMESDALTYDILVKVIDCLLKQDGSLKTSQKEEVFRRLQGIVETSFPKSNYIKHNGYRVIARAQLSRYRTDPNIDELSKLARSIENTADRALVLFATGTAIQKSERNLAAKLHQEARAVASEIPADWDRTERLVGFAQDARSFSSFLSKQLVQDALLELRKENYASLRRIVDLAYQIDQGFARELIEKLEDNRAQKRAAKQFKLLDLKRNLTDERSVEDDLRTATPGELGRVGSMLLGSLTSDRMQGLRSTTVRACLQIAAKQDLKRVYSILAWTIENNIKRYSTGERPGVFLRPLFEATVGGAQLAGRLAAKSLEDIAATLKSQEASNLPPEEPRIPDRQEALAQLKDWLQHNLKDQLIVCDSGFGPDDLTLIHLVRSVNTDCRIELISNKPNTPPPDGMDWSECFINKWSDISAQSPPLTRVTMIRDVIAGECPFQVHCLISGSAGIDIGTGYRTMGSGASSTLRTMSSQEVEDLRSMVEQLLSSPQKEWRGRPVRIMSFNLA